MKRILFISVFILISLKTSGQIDLPKFFGSNMVLQREKPITIWGMCDPGEEITVVFSSQVKKTRVANDSTWEVEFPKQEASFEPRKISISSENDTITLNNILVGDVWLLSGQSNMEWPLNLEMHFKKEIKYLTGSELRFFDTKFIGKGVYVEKYSDSALNHLTPKEFYSGKWETGGTPAIKNLSAVGYYFGKRIIEEINIPVGLINMAIGGAPIETFISVKTFQQHPEFNKKTNGDWLYNDFLPVWVRERGRQNVQDIAIHYDDLGPNHSYKPGFAYASSIPVLSKMPIKGILWYQGESNAQEKTSVEEYPRLQKLLIEDYRKQWGSPDLPFYWVQLSSIDTTNYKAHFWPEFRDQQRILMESITHSGMAVSSDIGSKNDVHPRNKRDVGYRLARWALNDIYNINIVKSGPLPLKAEYANNELVILFEFVGDSLKIRNNKELMGFSLNGKTPIAAKIENNHVVILTSKKPDFIYYGWEPFSKGNLINSENLPASTFKIKIQ